MIYVPFDGSEWVVRLPKKKKKIVIPARSLWWQMVSNWCMHCTLHPVQQTRSWHLDSCQISGGRRAIFGLINYRKMYQRLKKKKEKKNNGTGEKGSKIKSSRASHAVSTSVYHWGWGAGGGKKNDENVEIRHLPANSKNLVRFGFGTSWSRCTPLSRALWVACPCSPAGTVWAFWFCPSGWRTLWWRRPRPSEPARRSWSRSLVPV